MHDLLSDEHGSTTSTSLRTGISPDTSAKAIDVLFVCTQNSARSIMAEGLMNSLGSGHFKACSARGQPGGVVNPLALRTWAALRIPSDSRHSKHWAELARADAPRPDFVVTVCDNAAGEVCPVWPGPPMSAHWGVADPAAFQGIDVQKAKVFRDTAVVLKRRIELMLALPLSALDRMSLQREIKDIGTR